MDIKEHILNKSLELFNKKGSRNISTNEIGEKLAINPAIFFNHFKNKDDIILELFSKMTSDWESDNYQINTIVLTDKILVEMLSKVGAFLHKYRFIFKELVFLIQNDKRLKEANLQMQSKRINEVKQMIEFNIQKGILRKLTDDEKEFFVTTLWMSSIFWKPYIETTEERYREKNEQEILTHLRVLFQLFKS